MYNVVASVPVRRVTERSAQHSVRDDGPEDKQAADELILIEAARRERAAFAPLYRKYVTPIYRYFYQQVANASAEDAEDLTATTFSRAIASLDNYEGHGSFGAWLFGIARHILLDYRRAHYAQGILIDVENVAPVLTDPSPQPEAQVVQAERDALLRHLVRQLPDEQREAVILRVFAELRAAEVAAVLGKSEGAVKMLVHRAVKTLRTRYGAGGEEADS